LRIEIDDEMEKVLDRIRRQQYSIYGKGHSGTVKFLARFYEEHTSLEALLEKYLGQIPEVIRKEFLNSLRNAVTNIFAVQDTADEKHRQ